jgi:hypothetical protein
MTPEANELFLLLKARVADCKQEMKRYKRRTQTQRPVASNLLEWAVTVHEATAQIVRDQAAMIALINGASPTEVLLDVMSNGDYSANLDD